MKLPLPSAETLTKWRESIAIIALVVVPLWITHLQTVATDRITRLQTAAADRAQPPSLLKSEGQVR